MEALTRPTVEALTRPTEADASSAAWDALPESERSELLSLALAAALTGESEAERSLARRRGVRAMPVLYRAKRLAREKLCAQ